MSKAEAGMKLVRWLPELVEATADDIARFGPQASQVRGLLDFIRTMSDEAAVVSNKARLATGDEVKNAMDVANRTLRNARYGPEYTALKEAEYFSRIPGMGASRFAARNAALAEVSSDLLDADTYRTITNPLATGRAVDLLRSRPRYQGTPFLDVVRQAAERGAVRGPRDVIAAGRVARSPEDIREIAMTLMADGMPAEEAMRTAAML